MAKLLQYHLSHLQHPMLFLSFAIYSYDDLPSSMEVLQIDYVEEAAKFLFEHPQTNRSSGGVGLLGTATTWIAETNPPPNFYKP